MDYSSLSLHSKILHIGLSFTHQWIAPPMQDVAYPHRNQSEFIVWSQDLNCQPFEHWV